MTGRDRQVFAAGLYAVAEAFNESLTDLKAEAYFDALSDLPVDAVLPAMRLAIKECKFFPRPVEIRERVEPAVPPLALPAATVPGPRTCRVCSLGELIRDGASNLSPDSDDLQADERGLCIPCWLQAKRAALKQMPEYRNAVRRDELDRVQGLLTELQEVRRGLVQAAPTAEAKS